MKARTTITVQDYLIEQCKRYKINISETVERILMDKLKATAPYRKEEEAREQLNECGHCNKKEGWQNLSAICDRYNSPNFQVIVCKDCLKKPWKDTGDTLEEYVYFKRVGVVAPVAEVIEARIKERIRRDFL